MDEQVSESRSAPVVSLENLTKVYGNHRVVDGVTLAVYRGEVLGLLGPNGAGKTTTLEMMVGMRRPSTGTVSVFGMNPITQHDQLVRQASMQPQEANLFQNLTVWETLTLFASFYADALSAQSVLEMVGLEVKRNDRVKRLSGGQRQRLLLGVALVANRSLLFLDEPTGSLDPQARRQLWHIIMDQRGLGRTLVLTTHSMEEAQALCDRVAILDHGRVVALGAPSELVRQYFPDQIVVFEVSAKPNEQSMRQLPGVKETTVRSMEIGFQVRLVTDKPEDCLKDLLSTPDMHPTGIRLEQGSLEDVFLILTGRSIRDDAPSTQ